jgi:O-antigen/teichoic acid export membrane protein
MTRREDVDRPDLLTVPLGSPTDGPSAGQATPADPDPGGAGATPTPAPDSASDRAALSDGLALSLSGAVGSLAGFISWLVAARLMPQDAVGYASAFVSAFLLVAGTAQLNLDAGLMLWMPKAGRKAPLLYWRSHALIIPACLAVGLVYVLALVPSLAATGAGADGPHALGVLLFLVAAAGWGLWGVHDYTLVVVGKPWWTTWRNVAFAVVRIGLLLALGASLGTQGIVLSWVLPIAVWMVAGALIGGVLTRQFARRTDTGWLPSRREAVSFLGPTTVAHWGTVLLMNQVTVIVIERFGPVPGAAFFIAWQAVMVIDIAAARFMLSLSAQIARDPERASAHIAASRKRLFVIFVPLVLVGVLFADIGLQIFGPGYAEAANVLRVLLIGVIPRLVITHELGVRQALNNGMGFARLQLISTLLVIVVALFVPIGGASATGLHSVESMMPVAVGYTIAQAACALYLLVAPRLRRLRAAG